MVDTRFGVLSPPKVSCQIRPVLVSQQSMALMDVIIKFIKELISLSLFSTISHLLQCPTFSCKSHQVPTKLRQQRRSSVQSWHPSDAILRGGVPYCTSEGGWDGRTQKWGFSKLRSFIHAISIEKNEELWEVLSFFLPHFEGMNGTMLLVQAVIVRCPWCIIDGDSLVQLFSEGGGPGIAQVSLRSGCGRYRVNDTPYQRSTPVYLIVNITFPLLHLNEDNDESIITLVCHGTDEKQN
ncbi:hypothetical protein JTE90_006701 [Oedothorax gibbosus]|uniref:Uncharacterized protein n=1 Tax=Oedothorax gibbosus TaxID=931172 RepID=A0AAV6TWS3_9ARAC|nr:hypothetical protein JTE90_006701 [Oedothorax gibbosus]